MAIPVPARPLSKLEASVLRKIISEVHPEMKELLSQVSRAEVIAVWGEESASVDLTVPADMLAAEVKSGFLPVDAVVRDEKGELFGEILIWVTNGYLSAIEFAWYGNCAPTVLPELSQISVKHRP